MPVIVDRTIGRQTMRIKTTMARAGAADERHRQKPNIAKARNGLHDVGKADDGRARRGRRAAKMPSGADHGRQSGHRDERRMLRQQRGQLGAMRRPERKEPDHDARRIDAPVAASSEARSEARARAHPSRAGQGLRGIVGDEATASDTDAIGERKASPHVVRDDQHVLPQPGLDSENSAWSSVRVIGSKRAERFIHQQDRRVHGQGARDTGPLPLAAGELVGPS